MRFRTFALLLASLLGWLVWHPVEAQAEVQVLNEEPVYTFNEFIQFTAKVIASEPVKEVLLFVIPGGNNEGVQIHPATLGDDGTVSISYDLDQNPLRAFSTVEYYYHVIFENDEEYSSPTYNFRYLDNRYEWQTLESAPFRVYWYTGDITFAQEVLNVAHTGERRLSEILEVYLPEHLDIYIYSSTQELQTTLHSSSHTWVAGHADPDLGVILASLPPGPEQRLEIERQIPHELMHVALYYTDAQTYNKLPVWFNEGLASLAELYPSPEYQTLLNNAFQSGGLLPMASLCQVFPSDTGQLLQAYAQSASFTRYLFDQYGSGGLNRLRAAYATGMGCRPAVNNVLGTSLEGLEGQWLRETFEEDVFEDALVDLQPWLILLAILVIVPFIALLRTRRRNPVELET